jgi:hypothetical protein
VVVPLIVEQLSTALLSSFPSYLVLAHSRRRIRRRGHRPPSVKELLLTKQEAAKMLPVSVRTNRKPNLLQAATRVPKLADGADSVCRTRTICTTRPSLIRRCRVLPFPSSSFEKDRAARGRIDFPIRRSTPLLLDFLRNSGGLRRCFRNTIARSCIKRFGSVR